MGFLLGLALLDALGALVLGGRLLGRFLGALLDRIAAGEVDARLGRRGCGRELVHGLDEALLEFLEHLDLLVGRHVLPRVLLELIGRRHLLGAVGVLESVQRLLKLVSGG